LAPYAARLQALVDFWFAGAREPVLIVLLPDPKGPDRSAAGVGPARPAAEAAASLAGEMTVSGANAAAERLLGARVLEMAGRPVSSFLADDCGVLAALRAAAAGGPEVSGGPVVVKPRRGGARAADVVIRRAKGLNGEELWAILRN
jgi:PAS domain-containing protein